MNATTRERIHYVIEALGWMRSEGIWPNGLRYLWTDAFGLVLLVSLYNTLGEATYLEQAQWVVSEVERVLGRSRGIRIGEADDRDGQYFHYLAMWLYALQRLGEVVPQYHQRALELVREIHPRFVRPGLGVVWKMKEDLSGPYPGTGLGGLDHFHGYVVYRQIDPQALSEEIADMRALIDDTYERLTIEQDLGLGMMLWMSHFYPQEDWARVQQQRSLEQLDRLWIDPPGYFCRYPGMTSTRFAFTNYGVALGLQAVGAQAERVEKTNAYFEDYRSGDHYDTEAITHVMRCAAHFPGELIQQNAG